MRVGINPLKESNSSVTPPSSISVGVLSYVPNTEGYHRDSLRILALCLNSIRQNAGHDFDLIVLDNGSCDITRNYLQDQLECGQIDILILNERNIGKANGMLQLLRSSPGDFVFYSDGDIYYKQGWMDAHMEIMVGFPNVGIVGGIPVRNLGSYFTESTLEWAINNDVGASLLSGDLIQREWLIEYYHSIGIKSAEQLEELLDPTDQLLKLNDLSAYVGASHMQFLTRRDIINELPPPWFTKPMGLLDDSLDRVIDTKGYLRLSSIHPFVYHLGNTITNDWVSEELNRLLSAKFSNDLISPGRKTIAPRTLIGHWFWSRHRVRKALKYLYEWAYVMLWGNSG